MTSMVVERRLWNDRTRIGLRVHGIVYFKQSSHDRSASEKGRGGLSPNGAVHLVTTCFVQNFHFLRKKPIFNPSWETAPFNNANKTPRRIFICMKTGRDKVKLSSQQTSIWRTVPYTDRMSGGKAIMVLDVFFCPFCDYIIHLYLDHVKIH